MATSTIKKPYESVIRKLNVSNDVATVISRPSDKTMIIYGARGNGNGFLAIVPASANEDCVIVYNSGCLKSISQSGSDVTITVRSTYGSMITCGYIFA